MARFALLRSLKNVSLLFIRRLCKGGIFMGEKEGLQRETVAILVDGPQLSALRENYGKTIDPRKLLQVLARNRKVLYARWYARVEPGKPEAMGLISWLIDFVVADRSGYDLVLSREDVDSYIIIDIFEMAMEKSVDTVILVSGDGIFAKPVKLAKSNGIKVEVVSTEKWGKVLSDNLKSECDYFIELGDLEEKILKR
jgi:uncharacterized protein (TIGR00288 family)